MLLKTLCHSMSNSSWLVCKCGDCSCMCFLDRWPKISSMGSRLIWQAPLLWQVPLDPLPFRQITIRSVPFWANRLSDIGRVWFDDWQERHNRVFLLIKYKSRSCHCITCYSLHFSVLFSHNKRSFVTRLPLSSCLKSNQEPPQLACITQRYTFYCYDWL